MDIGTAKGLVWTPHGSHLIQIKATARKGSGKVTVDGTVGHGFLKALNTVIDLFQTTNEFQLQELNIGITVPGAIDGPSVGLPLFIAMLSAMRKQPLKQSIAFTGALSDTGATVAVEEVFDKLVAAGRAGLTTAVIPMSNFASIAYPAIEHDPWPGLYIAGAMRVEDAYLYALP